MTGGYGWRTSGLISPKCLNDERAAQWRVACHGTSGDSSGREQRFLVVGVLGWKADARDGKPLFEQRPYRRCIVVAQNVSCLHEPRSHLQQESGSLPRWLRGREDESRRPSRGDPSERHNLVLQAGAVRVRASLPEQHVAATMILVIWGGMAVVVPCAAFANGAWVRFTARNRRRRWGICSWRNRRRGA